MDKPTIPFVPFPKLSRFNRTIYVTEKLDGTNACVYITDEGTIHAASRTRWITPQEDNHGFAHWVEANAEELMQLGPGQHFGEWWGQGIQRTYGLNEKRFSLFNTERWKDARPACCHLVPVLAISNKPVDEVIEQQLNRLKYKGSVAVPGFMNPEGIVIFHSAANMCFKVTLEHDDIPKSLVNA